MASAIFWAIAFVLAVVEAVPYSKYGRTCKDIGCLNSEVCVLAYDPCTINAPNQCGQYPTCKKAENTGKTCATMFCPSGQYCRTENGKPSCVNTVPGLGYDSAGANTPIHSENGSPYANSNPYANANAPPAEGDDLPGGRPVYPSINSNGAPVYPAYPSQSGSSNNHGYPSYPTNNGNPSRTDLGYPPYPTQNRMPAPGQSYPQQPGYPSQGGQYPQYPTNNQKYPGNQYNPYSSKNPYNPNSIYRRNSASTSFVGTTFTLVFCTVFRIFHGIS